MRTIAIIAFLLAAPAHAGPCAALGEAAKAVVAASSEISGHLQSVSDTAFGGIERHPEAKSAFHGVMLDSQKARISVGDLLRDIEAAMVSSGCS